MERSLRRHKEWILFTVLVALALSVAAVPRDSRHLVEVHGTCENGVYLDNYQLQKQGWTDLERQLFWFTSQGSELVPYDWFVALEQANSAHKFNDQSFLSSLGFILPGASNCNPDGLPVGFAKDRHSNWLGLTCAACHTGEIHYSGRRFLIDGAPARINLVKFVDELDQALRQTLVDPEKWQRFSAHIATDPVALKRQLQNVSERVATFRKFASHPDHKNLKNYPGAGRVDAYGAIFNSVASGALGIEENFQPIDAPVSYPFLWGTAQSDFLQWNASAPNGRVLGPLARNAGEAIGVFGSLAIASECCGHKSSIDIDNLKQLEDLMRQLRAPKWRDAHLPEIDRELASQGAAIYQRNCISCHQIQDDQGEFYEAKLVAIERVGTDANMARNYLERTSKTGVLEGTLDGALGGERLADEAPTRDVVIAVISGVILNQPLSTFRASVLGGPKAKTVDTRRAVYKARPLTGIWATAPYLHNGSVPDLWTLLTDESKRPSQFYVGSTELDPYKVGFSSTYSPGASLFDANLPGNSNKGHQFGTYLDDQSKLALIEFIKTL